MSDVRARRQALESRALVDAFDFEEDAPSAFTETLAAAWALTRREEISTSAGRAWEQKIAERARVIAELGGDERVAANYSLLPRELIEDFRQAEAEGRLEQDTFFRHQMPQAQAAFRLVQDYRRRYPGKVKDDQALFDEFKAEAAELRAGEHHTMERGSGLAAFLGTAAAVFTDPLVLMTLPLGAEIGAGRSLLAAAGRTASIEGSIALATEIPIQAQVLRFKRELEAPWTWKDSAINVLAAGAGGAAIGAAIGGGVQGGRQALERYRAAKASRDFHPTEAMDDAEQALEDTIALHEQNPLELDGVPVDGAHETAIDRARAQAERGEPIDVRQDVAGLESTDGTSRVLERSTDETELVDIDPAEINIDAETFQFKAGADTAGVTDALRDVTRFDRRLAGVALIWERADGQRFIADGHQRVALARRALAGGQDPDEVRLNGFILRETDGVTSADARQMAAIKNMAEGTGRPLDAAKILREVGKLSDTALPPLPPASALVRQARGLAELNDESFLAVVNDVIDERFGALIGNATDDSKLQQAMVEVIRRTQPANETQARSIIDQVKAAGVTTRKTEDLFGEREVTESLYLERAQVLDAALKKAREDRALFGRLVAKEGRIAQTGANRLDRAANEARIQEASDATATISALANAKGDLSDALSEAARRVQGGAKPQAVAADFLTAARREILTQHARRRAPGRARPGREKAPPHRPELDAQPGRVVRLAELDPDAQAEAVSAAISGQPGKTITAAYRGAKKRQEALRAAIEESVEDLGDGIEIIDPGIKARETAEAKIERKGYTDAREVTDIVRLGLTVDSPDTAALVIERLGARFGVIDEGLRVTDDGFVDHKLMIRFEGGQLAELQILDPAIALAKTEGHQLYREIRALTAANGVAPPGQLENVRTQSRQLYAAGIAEAGPDWRRAILMLLPEDMRVRVQALVEEGAGSGGEPGNISKKALRESSTADEAISTGETRDQISSPRRTTQPSEPSSGTSRMAPGRASKLKNRSAIDASPRSIVSKVDDERGAQPQASKTGTVDDLEYETVLAQYQTLADDLVEQLTVADEVNGELVTRSAKAAIDELDGLEDTLERIRLCTLPGRAA